MLNKILLTMTIMFVLSASIISQTSSFRKAIFLHYSVGGNVYGPNGSNTSVPNETRLYNAAEGHTGEDSVFIYEEYMYPHDPGGNAWWKWKDVFDSTDATTDIYTDYINNPAYDIVIIKTCYTVSGLTEVGTPADTLNPHWKSVYNFKWDVRSVLHHMEEHPDKFFVIWNLVPVLNDGSFTNDDVTNDYNFSVWMKDTLATGLDATYGEFPDNVYIFDVYRRLQNSGDHYINETYTVSSSDNHLNAAGTELIAPLFVHEVFDAAFSYEQSIVPVELTLFSGNYEDGVVNLNWVTATETNNFGFEVERRNDNTGYKSIGFVKGSGTSTNKVTYNFVDKDLTSNRYYYRLKQIDLDGTIDYSNELNIKIDALSEFQLYQNYPNPFNPSTEIYFMLPKSGNITLKVYNSLGSEVATLMQGFVESGMHSVKFNAKDFSTGIYFYRITADNFTSTRKMLLIK